MAASAALSSWAAGDHATITSDPSPAVVGRPVTVTITTSDFGNEVYVYSWVEVNGTVHSAADWANTNVEKFRMSGSDGVYSYRVDDILSFYVGMKETDLANLKKLNFIAKTADKQTMDLDIEVIQAPLQRYSGGEGTESDPYILSTSADLVELSTTVADWGRFFRMDADIDAAGMSATIGNSSNPFNGGFDGNGKVIRNLNLTAASVGNGTGLFGTVGDGADIHDLGVDGATVSGSTFTGILAGLVKGGSITRCYSAGTVSATSICSGGLVGENGGTIKDCYSTANVSATADYAVGGLVGKNTGMIANSIASGKVAGQDYVGGVVGANYGTVSASVSVNSNITSYNNYAARFGGNNNSRNVTNGNYAWNLIPTGHGVWREHGDHATLKVSNEIVDEQNYKSLTRWDFSNVWEWRRNSSRAAVTRQGPVLRSFGENQPMIFPDEFFNTVSAVETIDATGNVAVTVSPNPTEGMLKVSSPVAILACKVYSIGGGLVAEADAAGVDELSFDLSGLSAGIYLLSVELDGDAPAVFKVTKK